MNNINAMGEKFKIVRNGTEIKETLGLIHYPGTKKEFIGFNPEEYLLTGDTLIRVLTRKEYCVKRIDPKIFFGNIEQLMVYYN